MRIVGARVGKLICDISQDLYPGMSVYTIRETAHKKTASEIKQ